MFLYQKLQLKIIRYAGIVCFVIMIFQQAQTSFSFVENLSDYQKSAWELKEKYGKVKILSTQNQVQQLYFDHNADVLEPPATEAQLLKAYLNGYRFLVIDPQAYISFTQDKKRFSVPLRGYLGFVSENVNPYKTYQHMNSQVFERFVLEHNVDLMQSLQFLSYKRGEMNTLRVYNVEEIIGLLKKEYEKNLGG